MKRYESYKDSGVYYLPLLPSKWEIKKAKFLFREEKRLPRINDEIITCFRDGQVTLRKNRRTEGFTNSLKEIGYKGIRKGDLVIHNMDAFAGAIGVSDSDGKGTPVYSVCTTLSDNISPYYYCYFLRYLAKCDFIKSLSKGIRERSTDFRYIDFKELTLPVPSIYEQNKIVEYIDSVTSKIDEAISQQQKMIDLLNERKQIIIQNAVTKGLDPNAKMKDSGVEWIGEIPEDWEISLIGHLFNIKAGGDAKPKLYSMTKDEIHKYPVYTNCNDSNSVYAYTSIPYFGANTITVTGRGDIGNAFFRKTPYDAIIRLLSLKPRIGLDCRFFTFFIDKVIPFTSDSAAVAQLSAVQLKNIVCCVPSKREQSDIADSLDDITSKIDSSISQCNKMIALLQERKQIIINDVVTGKIKVV